MKRLIILRGLPGSGKTTRAQALTELAGVVIANADLLVHPRGGDPLADPTVDIWALCAEYSKIRVQIAMLHQVDLIVLDNCHIRPPSWAVYLDLAALHGYEVIPYALHGWPVAPVDVEQWRLRSPHPVPEEMVASMVKRWQE